MAVALAWTDEAFHAKLLANPREALADVGHIVPASVRINVVEDGPEDVYFVIPRKPAGLTILSSENTVTAGSGSSSSTGGKCSHKCQSE